MTIWLALIMGFAEATSATTPPQAAAPPKVTCPPAPEERERLLALPFDRFDQDQQGGWRAYGTRECYRDAADLLDAYAERHSELPMLSVLRWHQAQLLAMADDNVGALAALAEVKRIDQQRGTFAADGGWAAYVLGTEAFLSGRKDALEQQLTAIQAFSAHYPTDFPSRINANVMKGLLKCFGQPYKTAYGATCVDQDAALAIFAERREAQQARQQPAAPK